MKMGRLAWSITILFFLQQTVLAVPMLGDASIVDSPSCSSTQSIPTPLLCTCQGYPAESHVVETEDGYLLTMHRIPRQGAPVVLLQHGLEDASHSWVINAANESLGFILHDAGFDVWMGNSRGNVYSTAHRTLKVDSKQFWSFSFDEMAKFDLPAQINYALQQTGQTSLGYVGHSQGTTQGFIGFTNAQLADKVNLFVALAPVAYLEHMSSPLIKAMASLEVDKLLSIIGGKRFLTSNKVLRAILGTTCDVTPLVCESFLCSIMGCNSQDWNATRLPLYTSDDPAGTSVQNMVHFGQLVRTGCFQAYDYGSAKANQEHYGSDSPPQYDLGNVIPPMVFVQGGKDMLSDPQDVVRLRAELSTAPWQTIERKEWSHLDHIWGLDARTVAYDSIAQWLGKQSQQK